MNSRSTGSERILVIDDEPVNLKLVDRMLQSGGFRNLDLEVDPRRVLERYAACRPDLILLDLNMPHMDGYQVLNALQALDDPMLPPVVILTAQHGRDFLLRALSAGARDYLTKPFDRNELLMRVRNLLDAHLAHRLLNDQKDVLEERVRLRTDELQRTRLQVVQRLGKAAEFRDEETGYHIMRMSHTSALLARRLGWGGGTVRTHAACEPDARHRQDWHSGRHSSQAGTLRPARVGDYENACSDRWSSSRG